MTRRETCLCRCGMERYFMFEDSGTKVPQPPMVVFRNFEGVSDSYTSPTCSRHWSSVRIFPIESSQLIAGDGAWRLPDRSALPNASASYVKLVADASTTISRGSFSPLR